MRKRPHTQGFLLWVSLIYTWAVSIPAPVKRINLERTTGHIVPLVSPKLALPSSIAPWKTEARDIPVFPSATHTHTHSSQDKNHSAAMCWSIPVSWTDPWDCQGRRIIWPGRKEPAALIRNSLSRAFLWAPVPFSPGWRWTKINHPHVQPPMHFKMRFVMGSCTLMESTDTQSEICFRTVWGHKLFHRQWLLISVKGSNWPKVAT